MPITTRSDMGVELVKSSASDSDVIWSARVSTVGQRSIVALDEDPERSRGLIRYLVRDKHGTPFEANSMTFLIETPIFVAREFMRHRIGVSVNEWSGRYSELAPVFYVPDSSRNLQQVGKPGHYEFVPGTKEQHTLVTTEMTWLYEEAYDAYQKMLEKGIAKEVARMVLPVGIYTAFYATFNARSLMNFLTLRTKHEEAANPSFPQREIEMVAEKMEAEFAKLMPITYESFNEFGRVAP